jgi:hypothetical protein
MLGSAGALPSGLTLPINFCATLTAWKFIPKNRGSADALAASRVVESGDLVEDGRDLRVVVVLRPLHAGY